MTTPFDDPRDTALATRLSRALGDTADETPIPDGAWERLRPRLGHDVTLFETVSYDGYDDHLKTVPVVTVAAALAEKAHEAGAWAEPTRTAPLRAKPPRWRTPLIAAASVAVLAGGIAAVSTRLVGPGHGGTTSAAANSETGETGETTTAPTSAPSFTGRPVSVPIACAPLETTPCAAGAELKLGLTDDPTSGGTRKGLNVSWSGDPADSSGTAVSHSSGDNGSPLSLWGADGSNGTVEVLYGAARPEVAQVQVLQLTTSRNSLPPQWIFADADTPPVPVEDNVNAVQAAWTEIAPGWHGYALHLKQGGSMVMLRALGSSGLVLQNLAIDLRTGATTNDVVWGTDAALATMTADLDPDRGTLEQIEASRRAEVLANKVLAAQMTLTEAQERQAAASAAQAAALAELQAARAAVDTDYASTSTDGRAEAIAREAQAVSDYSQAVADATAADAALQNAQDTLTAALAAQEAARTTPGG